MRPPQRRVRRGHAAPVAIPLRSEDPPTPTGSADNGVLDVTAELRRKAVQLKQAMETRPVIDIARGVLMAGFSCRPDEAWSILVALSQHANVKLRVVAEAVTATTTGQPMPPDLRRHLAAAVQRWQTGRELPPPGQSRRACGGGRPRHTGEAEVLFRPVARQGESRERHGPEARLSQTAHTVRSPCRTRARAVRPHAGGPSGRSVTGSRLIM
ncbi:ANTAR domain-containing protein [Streptomyces sp. NPDC088847]|uniref:ANTAR domain-containing protein n=1 Tax=Streptomyces sp. NPDC088847 TaxID=3365909 RepID=UPI00381AA0D7